MNRHYGYPADFATCEILFSLYYIFIICYSNIIMSKRRLFCSQLGTKYYGLTCYHNIYFMFLVYTTSIITVPNWEQAGVYLINNKNIYYILFAG